MNFSLFDRYLLKHLIVATLVVSITLAAVIMLTQSLRFLELVIQSGASSLMFWALSLLALPRFFEVIIPIGLMAGTVFVYNRMTVDSELIVMRATGNSPLSLAKPAIYLSLFTTILLWSMTMWAGPSALTMMQKLKQEIKTQYSISFIKEGIFNDMKNGLTVYMKEQGKNGELKGLIIHDDRDELPSPVTILAKYGKIITSKDGYQVVVYEGTRQEYQKNRQTLSNLDFERYTIDLPDENTDSDERWKKPAERTFIQLLNPDLENIDDKRKLRDFTVEAHRRIISPLLAPCFTIIALITLLSGPVDRRGLTSRIMAAVTAVIIIQGLYLAFFNIAKNNNIGLIGMYIIALTPIIFGITALSEKGELIRRKIFYKDNRPRGNSK